MKPAFEHVEAYAGHGSTEFEWHRSDNACWTAHRALVENMPGGIDTHIPVATSILQLFNDGALQRRL